MTHTEAQALREEASTIRTTLSFIRDKRSKQAKGQRAGLEARRDEIDKLLEGGPPPALSPDEIWGYIERWARRLINREAELKKSFLEKFEASPVWALSSFGQDVVIYSRLAEYARKVIEAGEGEADLVKRVEGLLGSFNHLGKHLQESVVSEARSGYMRSTNSMGNLTTLWQVEADARMCDDLFSKHSGRYINELTESYQAWQGWQQELATVASEE